MQDWKKYFQPKKVLVGPSFNDFMNYLHDLLYRQQLLEVKLDDQYCNGMMDVTIRFIGSSKPIIPSAFHPYVQPVYQRIDRQKFTVTVNTIDSMIQNSFPCREEITGTITYRWIGD